MKTRTHLHLFGLVALATLATTAFSTDWPQFRGLKGDGFSPEKGINKDWKTKQPKLVWKVQLGDNGFSGPAVVNGKVFVIDHVEKNDVVKALDEKTGKEIWKYSYGEAQEDRWGYTRTTPTVAGGMVYTLSRNGWLNCLNEKTGKHVWSSHIVRDLKGKNPMWAIGASPVVDGDKLIVVVGAPGEPVFAFNRLNGKILWKTKVEKEISSYATPIVTTIEGKKQYVVYLGGSVVGINPADGKVIWRHLFRAANIAQPIILGNTVFLSSAYGLGSIMVEVAAGKTKELWKNTEPQAHFSAPLLHNGYLYLTSDPDDLMCVNPKDGKVMWKQKGFGNGGLLGVDGVGVAIDGEKGDMIMFAFDPAKYTELGRFTPLGGQSWTAPILANGKYFIRNLNTLACYEAK